MSVELTKTFGEQRLDEVRALWESLPHGVHEGSGAFKDHRIIKSPKLLLVFDHPDKWPRWIDSAASGYGRIFFVAYPKPEHLGLFKTAAEKLKPGGPGENFPGSIGSISISVFCPPKLSVIHVQNHFKIGNAAHQISARLAREYAGWRKLALTELVRTAHSRDLEVGFPFDLIPTSTGARFFTRQLRDVAEETNSKVTESILHLILSKKVD